MNKFFLFVFVLLLFTSIEAQLPKEDCRLELENAPAIRGLKLGMSVVEVEKVLDLKLILNDHKETSYYNVNSNFPISAENPMHKINVGVGVKRFIFDSAKSNRIPKLLEDIRGLGLSFFDNYLYSIFIVYKQTNYKWKDSKELASTVLEKFNLPQNSIFINDGNSYLFCSGFSLSVKILYGNSPTIGLDDKKTYDLVNKKTRQAIADEEQKIKNSQLEKRRSFNP